ncbi:MAG TPA: hypothetical protein VEW03_04005 [Longimicrobiaceae bacterium]|nr:hypothetical protein [Longimicrobiaceae bacterium]
MAIRDWSPRKLGAVWVGGVILLLVLYVAALDPYWERAPEGLTLALGLLIIAIPLALLVLGFLWFTGWRHRKRAERARLQAEPLPDDGRTGMPGS